jgi:UDP-N-acetylglucosamine 4-epimerase
VIPEWVGSPLAGESRVVDGDGETSRDSCYVDDVARADLLAATVQDPAAAGQVYNAAGGDGTMLDTLFRALRDGLAGRAPRLSGAELRPGDVRHSPASIDRIRAQPGYEAAGLRAGLDWCVATLRPALDAAGVSHAGIAHFD